MVDAVKDTSGYRLGPALSDEAANVPDSHAHTLSSAR